MFSKVEKTEIETLFSKKLYTIPYRFVKDTECKEELYGLIPEGSRFYCLFVRHKGSQFCLFLNGLKRQLVFGFKLTKVLTLTHPIVFFGTKCHFKGKQMFCCEHVLFVE